MSSATSVVANVTAVSNFCNKCGANLTNPQHKFCADCFKKLPKKTAPKPTSVTKTSSAVEAPKAETKPAAPAPRPAPERPHIKVVTCGCGQKFVPRNPRHDKCTACFKKAIVARRTEEAKRTELLTAFRQGTLPKDAKVTTNGAQVVIVMNGVSTTLYDYEGYNARREADRAAEAAKAKAAADKARADAEKAAAAKARHDRIAKALFLTLESGKALPPTVKAERRGVNVIFTVSVVGQPTATYTAVDHNLAAAEDAARKTAEGAAKAARKANEKKGKKGKSGKAAA